MHPPLILVCGSNPEPATSIASPFSKKQPVGHFARVIGPLGNPGNTTFSFDHATYSFGWGAAWEAGRRSFPGGGNVPVPPLMQRAPLVRAERHARPVTQPPSISSRRTALVQRVIK